jgi:hypothetical protein
MDHLPVNDVYVLFHEFFRVPLGVPSSAVRFEIILPWPPLHLSICTCDTDESFQRALGWGFMVSSRFVVAVTIVFCRESNILGHTFGMTALEWLRMFSLVFAASSQHQQYLNEQ